MIDQLVNTTTHGISILLFFRKHYLVFLLNNFINILFSESISTYLYVFIVLYYKKILNLFLSCFMSHYVKVYIY